MPRVKIEYVVSFSSESPEAPASSLLASEPGRGRWLCARSEPSCSVLLQLPRAVQITSITIGAHLSALVEVLVGRSETPNDPFQVLVASSVFLSPIESRRATEGDTVADRVRTFNTEQLAADVRVKRWDRVRVVCSQPYNKHCKYGLSFIHIFSPEGDSKEKDTNTSESIVKDTTVTKPPSKLLDIDTSPQDSEDDEFKPGALFAKHRASSQNSQTQSQASQNSSSSTDSQIRKATSQAIKNLFGTSSTQIVRTPISKPKGDVTQREETRSDRTRDSLMYDDDDAVPNDKIDRLVAGHKNEQEKTAEKTNKDKQKQQKDKEKERQKRETKNSNCDSSKQRKVHDKEETAKDIRNRNSDSNNKTESTSKPSQSNKRDRSSSSKRDNDEDKHSKKQKISQEKDTDQTLHAGPVSSSPHTLLKDVSFVMSGYENPRRAAVRDAALAMGATFHRDWRPGCTHLICAFSNTPKLKTVRSSENGKDAIVVTAEWIERQAARCRRLPWQWFATESKLRVARKRAASGEDYYPEEQGTSGFSHQHDDKGNKNGKTGKRSAKSDSECDTDDEIEQVMRKNAQKRAKVTSDDDELPSKKKKVDTETMNLSQGSDVAFVCDERIKGQVTICDSDEGSTDKEDVLEVTQDPSTIDELPSFFEGCTFAVHPTREPVLDEKLARRYVKAYGGEIVEAFDDDEELEVDYVICLSSDCEEKRLKGRWVRGDWLWKCHEQRQLCSPGEYAL